MAVCWENLSGRSPAKLNDRLSSRVETLLSATVGRSHRSMSRSESVILAAAAAPNPRWPVWAGRETREHSRRRDRRLGITSAESRKFRERVVAKDTDPSDAESFGARRQPQIVHRETGRIDLDVADAGLAEHGGPEAIGLAGDDQVERRFEDAFELERGYLSRRSPLNWAALFWRLGFEDLFHAAPLLAVRTTMKSHGCVKPTLAA